jgi:uncharacterized membrane protein YkoI
MTRVLSSLCVALLLSLATPVAPVSAQGSCYSDAQTRAAVQSGKARPLSNFLAAIQARYGGQVTGNAQLCQNGGGLAYLVTLIVRGQVLQVRVNALTGAAE